MNENLIDELSKLIVQLRTKRGVILERCNKSQEEVEDINRLIKALEVTSRLVTLNENLV